MKQRISTRVGVYKMPPIQFSELDDLVQRGETSQSFMVKVKLREAAWTLAELGEELGLTSKQIHNRITHIRMSGTEVQCFKVRGKHFYAIRDGS